MKTLDRSGQTLDEKYRLERLLGEGGMAAVYLATHLGTERLVAVKLIARRFTRNEEFVERFKREARAAGRLRHPNIVDVTDFGFARAGDESIAYLVMEYLDGCTLASVLEEEKRLSLRWVVEILEQTCSAVQEAHQQGIVHRDLKPDNIWLEPNSLGGYRVKVLDFGIAKLDRPSDAAAETPGATRRGKETRANPTASLPPPTPVDAESATVIEPGPDFDTGVPASGSDERGVTGHETTRLPQATTAANLTRVGAILGTPAFMSPEQCRGEDLDTRSDIYSLGVIAYQMLSGAPPFTGETTSVMRAHGESPPTPLQEHDRRLPEGVSRVIMSALEKTPAARPQTALAFANALRANADDLGALYRRAFALYSEYFPLVLKLSLLAHIPVFLVMLMTIGLRVAEAWLGGWIKVLSFIPVAVLQGIASFVTASTISGIIAIIVTQLTVAPQRPVELRAAFAILRRRWWPFLKTGMSATLRILIGFILLVLPGIRRTMRYSLWAPVVLMEGLEKKAALNRSRELSERSRRVMVIALIFQFLAPVLVKKLCGELIGLHTRPEDSTSEKVLSQLVSLTSILVLPLVSIVPALLYLKLRQLGGETLTEVMAQINADTRGTWERRVRPRQTLNTPPKAT